MLLKMKVCLPRLAPLLRDNPGAAALSGAVTNCAPVSAWPAPAGQLGSGLPADAGLSNPENPGADPGYHVY